MTEEEITWKMPTVDVGDSVKVFPNGKDDGKPHLAFVARVNDRSIDIKSPLGTTRGGVRFINDPCMINNEGLQREYGAWDFTESAKMVAFVKEVFPAIQKELADERAARIALEKRVKTLEELPDKKTK